MRTGRVTQTIWNRSVKKQILTGNKNRETDMAWEEKCSVLKENDVSCFWSSASVSGNVPAEVKYAVLRAAGELAAKKIMASSVSVQIFFPESAQEQELKEITKNLAEVCEKMNLDITCIRAESTDYILRTMIMVTAVGTKENPADLCQEKTPGDRKAKQQRKKWNPGTEIIFCGYTGLEGTLRLIEEAEEELRTRFTPSFLEKAKHQKKALIQPAQIFDVPEEAKVRQCTDGGVLGGLWELAEAEGIGFEIDFSKLALKQETVEICEFFQLNPYFLATAGSYLILTERGEETLENLKKTGASAVRIGVVKDQNARVLVNGEERRYLDRPAPDELDRWWQKRK